MPIEFAKISRTQAAALPRDRTVFFFAVGPVEDHGPHLPLGLDLEEAVWLCRSAAEKMERELPGWVGVLMPPAPLALESDTTALAVTVRGHVLRDWLVDSCRSLMRSGFQQFVCFSGHLGPRQLTAIEEAGQLISWRGFFGIPRLLSLFNRGGAAGRRPVLVSASSALVPISEVRRSPFWPDPKEHGGKRDTSVALAIAGPSVAPDFGMLAEQQIPGSNFFSRAILRSRREISGYWGVPGAATAEAGRQHLQEALDHVFPKLRAVWEGADANFIFRSWYSVLPPNRSFFKSWLLAVAVIVLIGGWVLLTLQLS